MHGPVLRSHAHKLPKKVRRLGLKCALSVSKKCKTSLLCRSEDFASQSAYLILVLQAKTVEERLLVVDGFNLPEAKTVSPVSLARYNVPVSADPTSKSFQRKRGARTEPIAISSAETLGGEVAAHL